MDYVQTVRKNLRYWSTILDIKRKLLVRICFLVSPNRKSRTNKKLVFYLFVDFMCHVWKKFCMNTITISTVTALKNKISPILAKKKLNNISKYSLQNA